MRRQRESAQSTVVGALLVLALFAGVITYLQLSTFPRINENIEQTTFEESSTGLRQLSSDIRVATSSGVQTTAIIETQPNYPPQIVPPPPFRPAIRFPAVTDAFTLENATRTPGWKRTTQSIQYNPQYQFYTENPELHYEFGTVAYLGSNGTQALTGQRIVSGKTIRIVRVETRFSAVSKKNPGFNIEPVNQEFKSVTVTNTDTNHMTLKLKTSLDENTWVALLEQQRLSNDGYITDIDHVDNTDSKNTVAIQFAKNQRYTIQRNTVRLTN